MSVYISSECASIRAQPDDLLRNEFLARTTSDPNREGTVKEHLSSRTIASIRGPEILDILPDGAYITDTDRNPHFRRKLDNTRETLYDRRATTAHP